MVFSGMLKKILFTVSLLMFAVIIGIAGSIYNFVGKIPRTVVDGIESPQITEETAKEYSLNMNTNSLGIADNYQNTILKDKKKSSIKNVLLMTLETSEGRKTADSVMVLSLDEAGEALKISSLNGNSMVYVPGSGPELLKNAYSKGGAETVIFTVNSNFDLNISDFISIDTTSLDEMIDLMGGIEVSLSEEEAEVFGKDTGRYLLSGEEVKRFTSIPGTEKEKAGRNQEVMNGVIGAVTNSNASEVPSKAQKLLKIVNTSFSTDDIIKNVIKLTGTKFTSSHLEFPEDRNINGVKDSGEVKYNKHLIKENLHDFIFGTDEPKTEDKNHNRFQRKQETM